jgi:hypothetical protein
MNDCSLRMDRKYTANGRVRPLAPGVLYVTVLAIVSVRG